jgi:hypothetical protein
MEASDAAGADRADSRLIEMHRGQHQGGSLVPPCTPKRLSLSLSSERSAWSRRMRPISTPRAPHRAATQERRRGGCSHRYPRLGSCSCVDVAARVNDHRSPTPAAFVHFSPVPRERRPHSCFSWTNSKWTARDVPSGVVWLL